MHATHFPVRGEMDTKFQRDDQDAAGAGEGAAVLSSASPYASSQMMVVRRVDPRPGASRGGVSVTRTPQAAGGLASDNPIPIAEALFREFLSVHNVYVKGDELRHPPSLSGLC